MKPRGGGWISLDVVIVIAVMAGLVFILLAHQLRYGGMTGCAKRSENCVSDGRETPIFPFFEPATDSAGPAVDQR